MRVLVGTSGYSYKEWKGSFYPEDLPAAEMLRYYASRLPAVEINNTFYRMPTAALLSAWSEQVPEGCSVLRRGGHDRAPGSPAQISPPGCIVGSGSTDMFSTPGICADRVLPLIE